MGGSYSNGFSLGSYNAAQRRAKERQQHEAKIELQASEKAAELFASIESGKMVTLDCGEDGHVINYLKIKVRGDSRYQWEYIGNKIHFSAKRKG
jgi:hypothetical protein